MTFFKKINRGLVLLLVLVLAAAGYLVALHFMRISDKDAIASLTREYMSVLQTDLPLTERSTEQAHSDAKQNESSFFANESAAEPTLTTLQELYQSQETYGTIEKITLSVQNISAFTFDGNTATACVTIQVTYDGPSDLIFAGGQNPYQTESTLVYQKTDGEWKLFYFDALLTPSSSSVFD